MDKKLNKIFLSASIPSPERKKNIMILQIL